MIQKVFKAKKYLDEAGYDLEELYTMETFSIKKNVSCTSGYIWEGTLEESHLEQFWCTEVDFYIEISSLGETIHKG